MARGSQAANWPLRERPTCLALSLELRLLLPVRPLGYSVARTPRHPHDLSLDLQLHLGSRELLLWLGTLHRVQRREEGGELLLPQTSMRQVWPVLTQPQSSLAPSLQQLQPATS
jgi:hypothetical protein